MGPAGIRSARFTPGLGTFLVSLVSAATVLGCGSEPPDVAEPTVLPTSASPAGSEAPAEAAAVVVVPAAVAPYDEMWAPLRNLETLHQPLSTESARQMLATLREHGGSAPAGSANLQPMIISEQGPRGPSLRLALYSDASLLKPDTYLIEQPTVEVLKSALYTEQVAGASFNPYTTVSRQQVFSYSVNKLYLAGLVGYLTAAKAEPGRRWQAANAARDAGKPFEALHHALRSLEDQEQWARCELAKLWAMWELDFPGARDMAREELEWFIGEGYDTPEAREMLQRFRAQGVEAP